MHLGINVSIAHYRSVRENEAREVAAKQTGTSSGTVLVTGSIASSVSKQTSAASGTVTDP